MADIHIFMFEQARQTKYISHKNKIMFESCAWLRTHVKLLPPPLYMAVLLKPLFLPTSFSL